MQLDLEHTIGTAIKIGVLCEMIERVARAIKSQRDVMPAVISSQAILATGPTLRCR